MVLLFLRLCAASKFFPPLLFQYRHIHLYIRQEIEVPMDGFC